MNNWKSIPVAVNDDGESVTGEFWYLEESATSLKTEIDKFIIDDLLDMKSYLTNELGSVTIKE